MKKIKYLFHLTQWQQLPYLKATDSSFSYHPKSKHTIYHSFPIESTHPMQIQILEDSRFTSSFKKKLNFDTDPLGNYLESDTF